MSEVKMEGTLRGPNQEEKLAEIEMALYSDLVNKKTEKEKLVYFLPFLRQDNNDSELFHYTIVSVQVKTKADFDKLTQRVEELGMNSEVVSFLKLQKAEFDPSAGISFDLKPKK